MSTRNEQIAAQAAGLISDELFLFEAGTRGRPKVVEIASIIRAELDNAEPAELERARDAVVVEAACEYVTARNEVEAGVAGARDRAILARERLVREVGLAAQAKAGN